MLLRLFLCSVTFVPIIITSNITSNDANQNKTESLPLKPLKPVMNDPEVKKSNVTIITEGGSAVLTSPPVVSPKENHSILINLDKELGKDKLASTTVSKVVARKGVVYQADSNKTSEKTILVKDVIASDNKNLLKEETSVPHKDSSAHNDTAQDDLKVGNKPVKPVSTQVSSTKKPLILSYEELEKTDAKMKIPAIPSSANTIVSNQIPSPGRDGPKKRIEPMSASRHPGMIMPVVITILVVPMFAVLGYMALRRGQEAWKNRHYKRMDFLLDGMYNE